VSKTKQSKLKPVVIAGPPREEVSRGCTACDPEKQDERKYVCGTCVQRSLMEGRKGKKPPSQKPRRKRVPLKPWMKHTRARIYGKHILRQRYCRKCANWYFEDQNGKLDCDCSKKVISLGEYRKKKGLTQEQLAKEWNISQPMIAKMERGIRPIPARFQKKMKFK
jgi:DNA-binding XRE family transcriptional regulator